MGRTSIGLGFQNIMSLNCDNERVSYDFASEQRRKMLLCYIFSRSVWLLKEKVTMI